MIAQFILVTLPIMKLIAPFVVGLSTTVVASAISQPQQAVLGAGATPDLYLIELAPGKTKWITEDDKWVLRRVCGYRLRMFKRLESSLLT